MQTAETVNNVIGWTCNPYNRLCSAGGSSGGEGSLLAQRGAALGVGSDIGGSIRIPASVNGVWGLKSTPGRFSLFGARSTVRFVTYAAWRTDLDSVCGGPNGQFTRVPRSFREAGTGLQPVGCGSSSGGTALAAVHPPEKARVWPHAA